MKRGIRYRMLSMLTVAVCAVLSGAKSYLASGEWAKRSSQEMRQRMGCRFDQRTALFVAPSEPTLRRTLQAVDALALDRAVSQWLLTQAPVAGNAIALDGKTARGSTATDGKQTHLVTPFSIMKAS